MNNSTKNFLTSLALAIFLLPLALSQTAHAAFSDIEGHEYSEAIEALNQRDIINGYSDGTAKPDAYVNRAEFLKILMEAKDWPLEERGEFSDVRNSDWFAPYVYGASKAGLIDGYDDGSFKPGQNINFAEASKIITLAFGYDIANEQQERWYQPYVLKLSRSHAIPNSISDFGKTITRGETAEMIWRLLNTYQGDSYRSYGDLVKDEHLAAFQADPVVFAQKLLAENNDGLALKEYSNWVDPNIFNEATAVVTDSALYDDSILFDMPCKSIYRDFLFFTLPYKRTLHVKEFDIDTFETVPIRQFEDENCAAVYKDKNWVYVYNPSDPSLFAIAQVDDRESLHGINSAGIYQDKTSTYMLINGELKAIDGNGIDFNKLEGITFASNQQQVNPEKIHSCFGTAFCSNKIARFSHFTLYRDEDTIYFFDGLSFIPKTEIDRETFTRVHSTYDDTTNIGIIFFSDKNTIYKLKDNKLEALPHLDRATFEITEIDQSHIVYEDKSHIYIESKDGIHPIVKADYQEVNDGGIWGFLYAHDNENVYRIFEKQQVIQDIFIEEVSPILIEEMDPATFSVNSFEYGWIMSEEYFIYGESQGEFWLYDEGEQREIFHDNIDPSTFEILSEMGFKKHIEAGPQETRFHYSDPGVCAIMSKDFENGDHLIGDTTERLEHSIDGTCTLVQEEFSEAYDHYYQGFLAKDKNAVFLYDDIDHQLKEVKNIDGATFKQILIYPVFKDKNSVYVFGDSAFQQIENADPDSFEIIPFQGAIYMRDKDKTWLFDPASKYLQEIEYADFERPELTTEDAQRIIVTINDVLKNDAVMIDLESGEILAITDDMEDSDILDSGFHLFFEPNDPELVVIESISSEVLEEGTVFLVKTQLGTVYEVKIVEFFEDTMELVLDYSLINNDDNNE